MALEGLPTKKFTYRGKISVLNDYHHLIQMVVKHCMLMESHKIQ